MTVRVYGIEATKLSTVRVYGVEAVTEPSPYNKHYGYVSGSWVKLLPYRDTSGAWVAMPD